MISPALRAAEEIACSEPGPSAKPHSSLVSLPSELITEVMLALEPSDVAVAQASTQLHAGYKSMQRVSKLGVVVGPKEKIFWQQWLARAANYPRAKIPYLQELVAYLAAAGQLPRFTEQLAEKLGHSYQGQKRMERYLERAFLQTNDSAFCGMWSKDVEDADPDAELYAPCRQLFGFVGQVIERDLAAWLPGRLARETRRDDEDALAGGRLPVAEDPEEQRAPEAWQRAGHALALWATIAGFLDAAATSAREACLEAAVGLSEQNQGILNNIADATGLQTMSKQLGTELNKYLPAAPAPLSTKFVSLKPLAVEHAKKAAQLHLLQDAVTSDHIWHAYYTAEKVSLLVHLKQAMASTRRGASVLAAYYDEARQKIDRRPHAMEHPFASYEAWKAVKERRLRFSIGDAQLVAGLWFYLDALSADDEWAGVP